MTETFKRVVLAVVLTCTILGNVSRSFLHVDRGAGPQLKKRLKTGVDGMPPIDMNRIFTIESSNNERAHNKDSGARGLGQITEIVRKEFNQLTGSDVRPDDLFNRDTNAFISNWYMNERIPELLNNLNIEDTVQNRLISYNFGIGNLQKVLSGQKELPRETEDYLIKYDLGGDVKMGQQRLKELGFNPGPIDGILGDKTKAAFQLFQESDVQAPIIQRHHGLQTLKR